MNLHLNLPLNLPLKYGIGILALAALLFASCAKETFSYYAPASKYKGIQGSWKLISVQIKDDESLIALNSADVSTLLIGATPMQMSFDTAAMAFNIVPGTTQNVVGVGTGTWGFDDPLYPSSITFTEGAAVKRLFLNATVRPQDPYLEFKFKGGCAGDKSKYSYIFRLERTN